MTFSNTFEDEILDASLGDGATLLGSSLEIALSSTNPTEDGSGITEPSGNGYARVTVSNNSTYWSASSGGQKVNASGILFPTATGLWGTMSHWALFDTGVMKIYGEITDVSGNADPQIIDTGNTVRFLAGRLKITLD